MEEIVSELGEIILEGLAGIAVLGMFIAALGIATGF